MSSSRLLPRFAACSFVSFVSLGLGCDGRVNGDEPANSPSPTKPASENSETPSAEPDADLPIAQAPTGPATPPSGDPTVVERVPVGTDFAPVATEAERFACTSDADCVLTKLNDGSCCEQLCRTSRTLNAEVLSKVQATIEASCAERSCPVARCAAPDATYEAKCVEQSCVVYATPL